MADLVRLTLDEVHTLALQVLCANGVSEAQARAIADTITAAERDDCKSHGLFRLPLRSCRHLYHHVPGTDRKRGHHSCGLDRPCRMREGDAVGVPGDDGFGKGGVEKLGGGIVEQLRRRGAL